MVNDLIQRGLQQHNAGRLQEAKSLYEQVLMLQPQHPDALHLLGVIALQSGDAGGAAALIEKAIHVQPKNPAFLANLAHAYFALQRLEDAHAAFRRAARLNPRNPQLAVGAANCLAMLGRAAEAERQLRGVVRRHPGFALAWFNLANAVRQQGCEQEAADLYRRATQLEPEFPDAHNNLGSVLHALERFEEAEQAYRQYLALQPDSATGYCNLASVLIDRGRFADAETVCRQALVRFHDFADLHPILAAALGHQGKLTEALAAFRTAATLAPDSARALWAYGAALYESGKSEQAQEWLERARALQPDMPEFRNSMAGAYLSEGNLQAGWEEFEFRPARRQFVAKFPELSLVTELPPTLSGKNICLLREQGLGDELFFLRFAAMLKSRGAKITHRANAKIASILERVPVFDRVINQDDPVPAVDFTMLVGDIPRALGRLESSPYRPRIFAHNMMLPRMFRVFFPELAPPLTLAPPPEQVERLRQRLAALGPPPYLGITWRGGAAPEEQRGRSWLLYKQVSLQQFGQAVRGLNATFFALQRNPEPGEIEQLSTHIGDPVHDFTALNEDLEAMLALLALIDDYIGVSNTNMHLRAGVGKTARVLVPCPAEWRWMAWGKESPWFPGFRIYRQGPNGDWSEAVSALREDLRARWNS